jgi:DNA gyrase subunit A
VNKLLKKYITGKVQPVPIVDEMKRSYIDYAMSVIVGRALPDVRDGLKPVHRRILFAMYEMGMDPDKPHKKSARVVGDVLAKYHPHGDTAVYDAMVRLAQPFSTRYPLVDGHGNFGSVDGDAAAAMRYTEARLSKIATELLRDIDKDTVNLIPNYDESMKEPVVLPARFPNLLVNGATGIAVGMATNIPPHNLGEVVEGLVRLIDKPEISIHELTVNIKGPDFPTAGIIIGKQGLRDAYHRGRGSIVVRAKTVIEEAGSGKSRILVTELPYQVNKARLVEKIAELVREKKIEGISDLRDESDRSGMRVVIELKRDANANVILNQLYKHTQMQESFGVIMLALVGGKPEILNLKTLLQCYLEHQKEVVTRRTRFDLSKAEARAHIVEGLRIALKNLDLVIKIIRGSENAEIARQGLMEKLGLSKIQAQAILDMRLQGLTGLERQKLEDEYTQLIKTIAKLKEILANERLIMEIIKKELIEIKEKYSDPRRTAIVAEEEKMEAEDFIAEEEMVITITNRGYVKRTPSVTYRSQKRGGRGVTGLTTREEDFVQQLFVTTTHHFLLFFSNKGKVFRMKVHELPEAGRHAKGIAIVNLLYLSPEESITAVIPVRRFEEESFLLMVTKYGTVKKTPLKEFDSSRRDGIIAISLTSRDELIGVLLTDGTRDILLGTRKGLVIRFSENEVRSMGRTAMGVKGIALEKGEEVIGVVQVEEEGDLLTVTENGYGKRTGLSEFRAQGRGGKGVIAIRTTGRNGPLASIMAVKPEDEILIITDEGVIIRMAVKDISTVGRMAQGVTLMRLDANKKVVAVAKVYQRTDEE